jgi:hypothetical protein
MKMLASYMVTDAMILAVILMRVAADSKSPRGRHRLSRMTLPNRQLFWIANSTRRRATILPNRASVARCAAGHLATKQSSAKSPCQRSKAPPWTSRCAIVASARLPSLASPWKSALNQRCGMVLILATFQLSSRMLAASATAMPQCVQSPALNSRVMLCLQMSRPCVLALDVNIRRHSNVQHGLQKARGSAGTK